MRATVRLIVLILPAACAAPPDDAPRPGRDGPVAAQLRSGAECGSASGVGCGLAVTARHVVADRDAATLAVGGREAPA